MRSAEAPPAARVDPRVTRTRKLIRDALTSLLAEKRFETVTVHDIAARATINRATFYAHYDDKFALLDTLVREDVAARLAHGDPLSLQSVPSIVAAVGGNIFAYVASKRKCPIDRDFESQLQRAMEAEAADFLSTAFDPCAAMLVASAFVGAAMHWRRKTPKSPAEPIVTTIAALLVDGVESRRS
jgi:AcrR family transcriptional regulator